MRFFFYFYFFKRIRKILFYDESINCYHDEKVIIDIPLRKVFILCHRHNICIFKNTLKDFFFLKKTKVDELRDPSINMKHTFVGCYPIIRFVNI